MATLLTGIVGDLGKGFLGGAGKAAGLGEVFKPATMAMKSPVTGITSQVAAPSSIWNKIGSKLGEQAMSGGGRVPTSPPLPSPSSEITPSRVYQPPQKKNKEGELERLLRELASRR